MTRKILQFASIEAIQNTKARQVGRKGADWQKRRARFENYRSSETHTERSKESQTPQPQDVQYSPPLQKKKRIFPKVSEPTRLALPVDTPATKALFVSPLMNQRLPIPHRPPIIVIRHPSTPINRAREVLSRCSPHKPVAAPILLLHAAGVDQSSIPPGSYEEEGVHSNIMAEMAFPALIHRVQASRAEPGNGG